MIKLVHINNTDSNGSRFNGMGMKERISEHGFDSHLVVLEKVIDSENSSKLVKLPLFKFFRKGFMFIEKKLSIQSILFPFSFMLPFNKYFRKADIVHYHLIHNHFFSLFSLPLLTRLKKSVWTLHDPWALTGHCIHPFDCIKWKTGCHKCPFLGTNIPMKKDRTKLMWNIKKFVYGHSKLNLIVASNFMAEMVRHSPLLRQFNLKVIPFGLDLNVFRSRPNYDIRKSLGIDENSIVVAFRASSSEFKGLEYIKNCFLNLASLRKVVLLAFDECGILNDLKEKYDVIEAGWVENEEELVKLYNVADFFLMPSRQEAFGMMAIEAMACGKPVIVFDGTALPEVIDRAEEGCGGIVVPQGDQKLFNDAVKSLIENDIKRKELGEKGLQMAQKYYNENRYVYEHATYYRSLLRENTNNCYKKGF